MTCFVCLYKLSSEIVFSFLKTFKTFNFSSKISLKDNNKPAQTTFIYYEIFNINFITK